jgi:hypothetical protein
MRGCREEDISDPETREWEAKQVNRGAGNVDAYASVSKKSYAATPSAYLFPSYRISTKDSKVPPILPLPSLQQSLTALGVRLSSLTTSHLSHTHSLTELLTESEALETKEEELRKLIVEKEKERAEMEEVREGVETIGTFLGVKYPPLIEIEERHVQLSRERCMILTRRRTFHLRLSLLLTWSSTGIVSPKPHPSNPLTL